MCYNFQFYYRENKTHSLRFIFLFLTMTLCVYLYVVCAYACGCVWRPRALDPPGAGVTYGCQLPDAGAENPSQVL